jgi:superfamily II DNA helicase RecQ
MNLFHKENLDLVGVLYPVSIILQHAFVVVFLSPELAVHSPWRNMFQTAHFKKHLALIAVDEAHCIPEWLVYSHIFV